MKHIHDPTFKYTPACKTDIRKTFARVRREQAAAASTAASGTVVRWELVIVGMLCTLAVVSALVTTSYLFIH